MGKNTSSESYQNVYRKWKISSLKAGGYFPVFSTMVSEDVLNRVSGNAIRLYVYLGLRGDNETGECWITIETMARYFKKSKRTVSYWLSELENVGLIKRIQFNLDESAHTFLRPYGSKHFRPMDSALNTGDFGLDEIGSNDSEQR